MIRGRLLAKGEDSQGSGGDQEDLVAPAAITTATEADLDRREAALRRSAGPFRECTTADGAYRLWPEALAWRRGWRWAKCNVPDHNRGCFHGAAPTLAEALRAIAAHREEYRDG